VRANDDDVVVDGPDPVDAERKDFDDEAEADLLLVLPASRPLLLLRTDLIFYCSSSVGPVASPADFGSAEKALWFAVNIKRCEARHNN